MKQLASLALVMLLAVSGAFAKDRVSPHTTVKGNHISITYGQPSVKGRQIFGGLVPWGQVWRTGADEATEITIDKDCTFAGKSLKAGTYTLFTIPGQNEWKVILNSKLGQWGSFDYEKNKGQDVLNASVPVRFSQDNVETMSITIVNDAIRMQWEKANVLIPVTFK